jgi:predicted phage terminase large subunit-like protein
VRLHPAQQAFIKSDALFRAFCGGIGSGKSWAGAYDLLRRAKPGRLYLVVAPTYAMLSDATFRSFVGLAESLGALDPSEVKRSAPPSVRLRTQAEVLFRSADEPDRLRGPNLSGVWLDEASLMHQDVFSIAIGRLREGGEQGWLSATFTPKGRQHWTFETFATDRPDTHLVHCRTRDNPFLPPGFHDTVARQYTSTLADQELEGLFTDTDGVLFQRKWFGIVEELPPLVKTVRAWDLAATPKDEESARDPDWTAGVLLGRGRDRMTYVLDVRRVRESPKFVELLVTETAKDDGRATAVFMEQEPGSSGKAVTDSFRRLLSGYRFFSERPTGCKADRAQPLAAAAEQGMVKLLADGRWPEAEPWNAAFLDELCSFPFGRHDDQVDAASAAFTQLGKLRILTADGFFI